MFNNFKFFLLLITALAAGFLLVNAPVFASNTDGTIDSTDKYVWGENIGWVNFGTSEGAVHVVDSALTGYAWGENTGWISLNCSNDSSCGTVDYKVANDSNGNLSGYAWSENAGWINFNPTGGGVTIDTNGDFAGYAWGENTGWLVFNCATTSSCSGVSYKTSTDWRPSSARTECNNGIDDDNDGKTDYPADSGCTSADDDDETNPTGGVAPVIISGISEGGAPFTNFKVRINNNEATTASRFVRLHLTGADNTATVAVSNFSDFQGVGLSIYQPEIDWDLCHGNASCPDGQYTVYVRFYNRQGYASEIVSASVNFKYLAPAPGELPTVPGVVTKPPTEAPPISFWETLPSFIKTFVPKNVQEWPSLLRLGPTKPIFERLPEALQTILPEVLRPGLPGNIPPEVMQKLLSEVFPLQTAPLKPVGVPIEKLIPKEAPLSMNGEWRLMASRQLTSFVFAPLPQNIKTLAQKIPQLGKTFHEVGIKKITDVQRLAQTKIILPGLTQTIGWPTEKVEPGRFILNQGTPLVELTPQYKAKIPSEIVFAKGSGELIDYSAHLNIGDQGQIVETIRTMVGQVLHLSVKPEGAVKSVVGYIVFKSKNYQPSASSGVPLDSLLASLTFARPVLAMPLEQPVNVENKLVLQKFEYTDPDRDGIYTAEVQAPLVDGEYEVITVLNYTDPALGSKAVRLIAVIDPEGYVFEKVEDKETRIPGAIITLFWLNPETKQYELWPAKDFQQENPQVTDTRGTYAFLVPDGLYYLKVEAPGYLPYDGRPFTVKEGSGVHINIELKDKYWWLRIVDWKTLVLIVVILLLIYNFYRDKKRERALKNVGK